ncbi:dom, partial [Symbiodinium sp. KB8]
MSRMLDVLETWLNFNNHTYLRLDGSTKVEERQKLMDWFNNDTRIFCFILSTRSGGLGINLTGADTVIFYDSDWNPAMDAQAQDRAHRIGQTRDVHIYRLVTESTVEENILLKAQQKRHLYQLSVESAQFTTDFFQSVSVKDLVGDIGVEAPAPGEGEEKAPMSQAEMMKAFAEVEDAEDYVASKQAAKE